MRTSSPRPLAPSDRGGCLRLHSSSWEAEASASIAALLVWSLAGARCYRVGKALVQDQSVGKALVHYPPQGAHLIAYLMAFDGGGSSTRALGHRSCSIGRGSRRRRHRDWWRRFPPAALAPLPKRLGVRGAEPGAGVAARGRFMVLKNRLPALGDSRNLLDRLWRNPPRWPRGGVPFLANLKRRGRIHRERGPASGVP